MAGDADPPKLNANGSSKTSVIGRLNQSKGVLEKNLRDLPRLVRESGVDQYHAEKALACLTSIEQRINESLIRTGCQPLGRAVAPPLVFSDRRIATHTQPDVDAIAACWLAERYLFANESSQILFVPRNFEITDDCPYNCVLDLGRTHDPTRLLFDHKPPAVPDRHSTCATKLLWEHLRSAGHPVEHLSSVVELVWDGDSSRRRSRSAAYRASRSDGLHAEFHRLKQGSTDPMLYVAMRLWLDRQYPHSLPSSTSVDSRTKRLPVPQPPRR